MEKIYEPNLKIISTLLEKCNLILQECVITLKSLLSIHNEIKRTEEKEDLLRAMLVFSAAGIDSIIKQAIKDTLHEVIDLNVGANNLFEEFVDREIQIKKGEEINIDSKLIAKLLTSSDPRHQLKKRLVYNLTSNSLQSKDQILKIASYFDIPSNDIVSDFNALQKIFIERNKIVHEMDINFDGDRSRNKREITEILEYINSLLKLGEKFIIEVDKRLIVNE